MNRKLLEKIVREETRKKLKEMTEDGLEKRIYDALSAVGSHGEEYAKNQNHVKSIALAMRKLPGQEQTILKLIVDALRSYQNEQDFFADNPGLEDEDPARQGRKW